MSLVERVPETRSRLGALVAAAAGLWVLAYWVNERLWDWVFYDALGMTPDDRLTETIRRRVRACCLDEIGKKPEGSVVVSRLSDA
mgnify:CR=1 FL=1